METDNIERCSWATTDLYKAYHDNEWGVFKFDDNYLFEKSSVI